MTAAKSLAPSLGPDEEARRARRAISLVFLLNGLSFCAILPRLPQIVDQLQISNTALGTAVVSGPIGGLVAGAFAARIMNRFQSGPTAVGAQILATTAQLMIFVAPSWGWLVAGFVAAAGCDAVTDIAQNSHGMRVERRYGRSIMNSYHGFWSLGAVLGGVIGSLCAQLEVPLWLQGSVGLVAYGLAGLANYPALLKGPDALDDKAKAGLEGEELAGPSPASASIAPVAAALPEGDDASDRAETAHGSSTGASPRPGRAADSHRAPWRSWLALAALGMLLVFAGSSEDAGNTWGALYMKSTFNAIPFVAGLAFVALQGTQMVARFLGDRIVDAWGDRLTARVGAVLSAAGMSVAMLIENPAVSILGFALTGWGIATLFPAAFRAGDDMPGLPAGVGITFIGWFSRLGFLVAPPLVGALADAFTLRYVLWLVPLYAVGIFLFSGVLETKKTRV